MKIQLLTVCISIVICLSGCREKVSYDLRTRNRSNEKLYECTIIEFEKYIPSWSGTNPETGGSAGPVTVPVPDRLTIKWKTIKPGKEKEVELYEKKIDDLSEEYFATEGKSPLPQYTRFPSNLYVDHEVILALNGKVPKKPRNGEIIITYTGDEHFDVQYVEKAPQSYD